MRHLFIGGCQRSGTTALGDLLNEDDRIIMGRERYKRVLGQVTPAHFEPDKFFDPQKDETNHRRFHLRKSPLHAKYESGNAVYIGDKTPRYFMYLRRIFSEFPEARFLFLLRDLKAVASSFQERAMNPNDNWAEENDYRAAPVFWNKSLEKLDEIAKGKYGANIFVVQYERFYAGGQENVDALYEFLKLDPPEAVRGAYTAATEDWPRRAAKPLSLDDEMIAYVESERNTKLEQKALKRCPMQV